MASRKPIDSGWIETQLRIAQSEYQAADAFAQEVEDVLRGASYVPEHLADGDIIVTNPSLGRNRLNKILQMVAVRSQKRIQVLPRDDSPSEKRKVERLDRFCQGYLDEYKWRHQNDVIKGAAYWLLKHGRGILRIRPKHTKSDGLRLIPETPDPFTCWPMDGDEGLEWVVLEYKRPRWKLMEWYSDLKPGADFPGRLPDDTFEDDEGPSADDLIRVVEYWDEDWHALSIGGEFIGPMHHEFGIVPFVQGYLKWTPEMEKRWSHASFLGDVLDDLKNYAALMSKQATGVEQFTFPLMYYQNEDGNLMRVDHHNLPGEWENVAAGTEFTILNPVTNSEAVERFKNEVKNNIGQGTLSEVVYSQDIPNVSGFLVSQILSLIRDAIADIQFIIEQMTAMHLGQVLYMHEHLAPLREDGAWEYALPQQRGSSQQLEKIRAKDIDGHHRASLSIRVALPQDKIQLATIANQLRGMVDQTTGMPMFDEETILELSGMGELIDDPVAMDKRRKLEMLIRTDEETMMLYKEHAKAELADTFMDWRESVADYKNQLAEQQQKEAEEQAREEFDEPLVIPPNQWTPAFFQEMANGMQQGVSPRTVMSGLPLGMPDANAGQPADGGQPLDSSEIEQLQAMMRQASGQAPLGGPDQLDIGAPFQGMAPGINPEQMPLEMAGQLPRQSMDRDRLAVEQMNEEMGGRSPALPPRK